MMTRFLMMVMIVWGNTACDFISTASELTFGAGSLPALEQEMTYPSADELVGLDVSEETVGLPTSLNDGTMAHLVGALGVSGECGRQISQTDLGMFVRAAEFELAACTEDDRCPELCGDGFLGLYAKTRLEAIVMSAKQAENIASLLSEDSADAIVQLRFQIKSLEFFQGEGDRREVTTEHIQDFEMWLGTPDVEPLLFLTSEDLKKIEESSDAVQGSRATNPRYERYELPREHPMTLRLIEMILRGEDVILSIEQSFKINRDSLYDLKISPAGIYQSIQPEVIVNAIEATTSTLSGE